MASQRLSKLQKWILAILYEKDKIDWTEFYKDCRPYLKAPYWHRLRDMYDQPRDGDTHGRIIEKGVSHLLNDRFGDTPSFSATFSRSLKNLLAKNCIEARFSDKGQISEIRLTAALKVKIQHFKLNDKKT